MRLEDQGKEVKKTGYLRGTRMWAIRNRILAGFGLGIGLFYVYWFAYAVRNADDIRAKREEKVMAARDAELIITERTKAFEKRHAALQQLKEN